jgi:hypothetical protein
MTRQIFELKIFYDRVFLIAVLWVEQDWIPISFIDCNMENHWLMTNKNKHKTNKSG